MKTRHSRGDPAILAEIKQIIGERPTYGYRRVTAIMRAKRKELGQKMINHKRVYRLMKVNNLLLARYAPRPERVHEGQVMTKKSNSRWCSDAFYITCDNGERVQVAFSLDTCDREAISYVSTNGGINGAMICDLMAETMIKRFKGADQVPHKIQWLSDNGPCYVARETVKYGRSIGLEICRTRPYSPESNGMAEAFVKTIKRDYVSLGDLSSAKNVMKQLPCWFEDYNEKAPHKSLNMMSPREYIRNSRCAA